MKQRVLLMLLIAAIALSIASSTFGSLTVFAIACAAFAIDSVFLSIASRRAGRLWEG